VRVIWTRPATNDLEAIGDYIAHDDPRAAARTVRRIVEHADILSAFPQLGHTGRFRARASWSSAAHRS
jgi:plasmid stabilization system protein ParE